MEKTIKEKKKQLISIPNIIAGTAVGFLIVTVFVLMGVLYYMSSTASNLSAALGYRFVYDYEWGGEQRSIDTNPGGAIDVDYEWGEEQRNVYIDPGIDGYQDTTNYQYRDTTNQYQTNTPSTIDGQYQYDYEWGGEQRSVEIFSDTGRTIPLQGDSGSLNIEASNLSTGARTSIVNLEGNSILLINSSVDVKAYSDLIVEEKPGIQRVSIENNSIKITYRQPAKFLGFVPVKIKATVEVNNSNQVRVNLPWYHIFYVKDVDLVAAAVQFKIIEEANTSSNTRVLINPGGVSQTTVQAREAAWRVDIVSDVVGGRTIDLQSSGGGVQFETNYEWGGEQRSVEIDTR